MEMDFLDPQGAEHMPEMADSSFALDFLLTVKSGVKTVSIKLKIEWTGTQIQEPYM
ncbi:hypothetical protein [Peribacillus simplex]|uniref:hypothetical protein n=1 Tax=Peribacillus simplex TaxID=1478 RepID=UPI001F4F8979|nr:hypothetical protein [Peribacillus simplex]